MKTDAVNDVCDYMRKYGKWILVSVIAAIICYGFLVFSGNIRIDTEELINHPGSKLGWLTIGRFGLAFLKDVLGLGTHNAVKSGLLFFVFFLLGANLLTFSIWRFSQKRDYPYWIFLLLYVTSNIWSYQIYFSVQQAEVACAMFLLIVAAICAMQACFEKRGVARVWRLLVAMALLVLGLGAYQAMAVYYVAVCLVLFLAWMDGHEAGLPGLIEPDVKTGTGAVKKEFNRRVISGIAGLLVTFGLAYVSYSMIAKTWFMATADYMGDQMGWGKYPVLDCIKNILRTVKNLVLGNGPRNFSFYTFGVLFVIIFVIAEWRRRSRDGIRPDLQVGLKILALVGLAVSPFLMTIYMGEMLVTRSQFALPVAAAFLGMYAVDGLRRLESGHEKQKTIRWVKRISTMLILLTVAAQTGYNLQMAYTDHVRYEQDVQKSEQLVTMLEETGDTRVWDKPILFVGYQKPELDAWCGRTEMYGWSFYEWDYSVDNPTGTTHRIAGFLKAYMDIEIQENATEQMKQEAVKTAEGMPVFPDAGSVLLTEDYVVVKLSEVTERTDLNWW